MSSVVNVPKEAKPLAHQPKYNTKMEEIFKVYGDVLSGKLCQNPPVRGAFGKETIPLKQGYRPRRHRDFQMKGEREQAMINILKEFMERGWIEPCSSELASPCFVVQKKVAGEWRLVVDYRDVNSGSKHGAYSLPLIDNLLQKQQGKGIFSVLDLKHEYHQMPLVKSSQDATAISTPLGLMRWKVMAMGVKKGNTQLHRMTEYLLRDQDFADPFVDDIIVSSGTPETTDEELIEAHFVDLCTVLTVLRRHQLTCNGAKAVLFTTEMEFAGQVVGRGIRRPIPGRLASHAHCEQPKNITEMRALLGFCNYYSPYVHMYAQHAAPLTRLLQVGREDGKKGSKKALDWTPESEKAYDDMKAALLKPLSLHLLNADKGFVLRTDASDYAVSAVLEQVQEDGSHVPAAFWSCVLDAGR